MNSNSFKEVQVSYKPKKGTYSIDGVNTAVSTFRQVWDNDLIELQERVYCLFLTRNMSLIGWKLINAGTETETVVDSSLIIRLSLTLGAKKIIIAHNHPNGSLTPSSADLSLTEKLLQTCKFLGISLVDHLILTKKNYYSFAENDKIKID